MRILFYTPLNTRCLDIESQAAEFKKAGHEIFLLTQSPYYILHENFKSYGYLVAANPVTSNWTKWLVLKRWFYLVVYCRRHRIDVLYAHLEPANFIAILAQYFVRTRVIICRHHIDEAKLYPFGKDLSYKLTYKLAREIIVVSARAKEYMIEEELVPASRIYQINLSYNFDLYASPNSDIVRNIREQHSAEVLLLSVCRLTRYKRPELSIEVLKKLYDLGLNAKLIILGKGELMGSLQQQILKNGLEQFVSLAGYVSNVQDYMAASDFLVHPSLLESSCISLKEAGLVNLPIIVCKNIGDFNEVINHENGFKVNPDNFVDESVTIINKWYKKKDELAKIGQNLHSTVLTLFDIAKVAPYYEKTFHQKR